MQYSYITQRCANKFPRWSAARTRRSSTLQQYINPLSLYLEEASSDALSILDGKYPYLNNMDDVSQLYFLQLPENFSFSEDTSDPHHPSYTAPVVKGDSDTLTYIKELELFLTGRPNSVVSSQAYTQTLTGHTLLDAGVLTSGVTKFTTFNNPGLDDYNVFKVNFLIEGSTNYGREVELASLIVKGVLAQDTADIYEQTEVEEFIPLRNNGVYTTFNTWQKINSIEIRHVDIGATLSAYTLPFLLFPTLNTERSFYLPSVRTSYTGYITLRPSADEDYLIQESGRLSQTITNPVMSTVYPISDDIYDKDMEYDIITETALEDITTVVDYAVRPRTNDLYVLDSLDNLYIYDTIEPVNTMSKHIQPEVSPKNPLIINKDNIAPGSSIRVNTPSQHPLLEIRFHRLWLEYDNGTMYSLADDGTLSAYDPDIIITKSLVTNSIEFTPSGSTQTSFILWKETFYTDDYSDVDGISISINSTSYIKKYDLSSIGIVGAEAISFDFDQKLHIVTGSTTYEIGYEYDTMYIDYNRKLILFRDDYTEVTVTV